MPEAEPTVDSKRRMTNSDRILQAIRRHPGATDAELRVETGVEPHQQVNQICRRLAHERRTIRRTRPDGRIGNYPSDTASPAGDSFEPMRTATSTRTTAAIAAPARHSSLRALPRPADALIVLPCSSAKRGGGSDALGRGPRITDRLSTGLAHALASARTSNAYKAAVDDSLTMAAHLRYNGHLYNAGRSAIDGAIDAHLDVVILSGGYGVLDPLEPIGQYNRALRLSDWAQGLLESTLLELASVPRQVVAFYSRTTAYVDLLKRVDWQAEGVICHLVSPVLGGRGGAQVLVPRATGEALSAYLDGALTAEWRSSDGLGVTVEVLQ